MFDIRPLLGARIAQALSGALRLDMQKALVLYCLYPDILSRIEGEIVAAPCSHVCQRTAEFLTQRHSSLVKLFYRLF